MGDRRIEAVAIRLRGLVREYVTRRTTMLERNAAQSSARSFVSRDRTMPDEISQQFHHAMLGIYDAALKLKPPYRATRFLSMVHERGGKAAADQLLASANVSQGFTELFIRGKDNLKLSVEYLVLQPEWSSLFTLEQLSIARKRLIDVGCPVPGEKTA